MSCRRYGCRGVSALAAFCLFAGMLAGCSKEDERKNEAREEVSIPMILTVDPSTGNKNEEELVKAFNETYRGTWKIDVEWIVETEEEYRQNLKRLNVTDKLPAIITDLRMLPSFYNMMIQDGRIEDLSPYIEADPEWQEMIEPAVLNSCSEPGGEVYLAPVSTAAFACSGVFWNEELFAAAGITEFPKTWEAFWECCEKLSAQGITPLALHTEGTAWAPMLLATAELASSPGGEAFMKELFPDSYQNAYGIHLAETLQRLFTYTTEDALYMDFDKAYENFFSEKAAMVPNGYWMIDQIPETLEDQIRFSQFPGSQLISSPETFGWAVVSSYSDEIKEGAVEFLKFRTKRNLEDKERMFSRDEAALIVSESDYIEAYKNHTTLTPSYQVKWNSILQEKALGETIPELVLDRISPEECMRMWDESIREYKEEQ